VLGDGDAGAATTRAAAVDTFRVHAPSPPVPQVSTVCAARRETRPRAPHGARRTDELVDRLALHAERDEERPDLRRGRVPPRMRSIAAAISGSERFLPVGDARDGLPERHAVPPGCRAGEEVREQPLPFHRQDRLGMKLHALDEQCAMAAPMISRSAVQAVGSSVAGSVAGSITSE